MIHIMKWSGYWTFRLSGGTEEVSGVRENNPFTIDENGGSTLSYMKPLLNYFSFKGTGTRDSNAPAQYILSVGNPEDISTWIYYTEENFIDSVWEKLVFSLRSKGTPKELTEEILPWVREVDDKKKGALNVRVG